MEIKLSYVTGLREVALIEVTKLGVIIVHEDDDSFYITFSEDYIAEVKKLKSITRVYLVVRDSGLHPAYISNHKSVLGDLVDIVLKQDHFKTFKISCAGADSREVREIVKYVAETYKLNEADEADLKIHIIKNNDMWEVGMQLTPRPLSVRDYRVVNMSGAMDPTIANAVNTFGNLENAKSYLNIFSGSGTLLIEAGQGFPNLEKIVGFDNDKKHLSLSIQNIKKAGLIEKVRVVEADIFTSPDLGMFDCVVSDLPFGMAIGKGEDLEKLYKTFVEYCERVLNTSGRMMVYTSEYEILENVLNGSKFKVVKSLQLKFITNVDAYLKPKIIVCEFK